MTVENPADFFNAYYYAHGCGAPYGRSPGFLAFFEMVADRIVRDINPASVLDAGCAMGFLVESLRRRGVEAYGIDISEYAIQQVHPDIQPFCTVGSIVDPFPRRYDLIVSIEVLEHMPKAESEKALVNFCQFSDDVLFSSTPYDYRELTHFNVQPPEVWAEMFGRQAYFRDVNFDASFITPWAARFRKRKDPAHVIVREYEQKFAQLWKENSDLRSLLNEMRQQAMQNDRNIQELAQQLSQQSAEATSRTAQTGQKLNELQFRVDELDRSLSWKIAQALMNTRVAVFPPGSGREKFFQSIRSRLLKK